MTVRHAPILALATLSGAIGLASLTALIALNTGAAAGLGPFTLGSTDGYEKQAHALLLGTPTPADLDRAEALARKTLAISPYANTARLRLAYVDSLRHGAMTPEGVRLFVQSYELLPTDQNVAAWRIRFGLEHWAQLTPQARAVVQNEAMAFARARSANPPVRQILGSIRNPNGRLAAALWLRTLDR